MRKNGEPLCYLNDVEMDTIANSLVCNCKRYKRDNLIFDESDGIYFNMVEHHWKVLNGIQIAVFFSCDFCMYDCTTKIIWKILFTVVYVMISHKKQINGPSQYILIKGKT